MSHHVVSEVYKRQVGKMPRVAVLALMADKASDDGRGIWASKMTLADELGCSKQTMLSIIDSLVADGLLIVVGEKSCSNGHTIEYRIDIDALEALPLVGCHKRRQSMKLTGQKSGPVKSIDPTGQKSGPDRSKILTQTTLEPSLNHSPPTPRCRGGGVERVPIPENWDCGVLADLPAAIGALAAQWPAGAFAAEAAAFHQHWRGRGQKRPDWRALWAARVQARHDGVMRAAKAGVSFVAPGGAAVPVDRPAVAAQRREDARSADLRAVLAERLGAAVFETWFGPVALVFDDCGLSVVTPSAFHAGYLENHHRAEIDAALSALGIGVDWVTVTAEKPGAPAKRAKGTGSARRAD